MLYLAEQTHPALVHYIPVATTVLSIVFTIVLMRRFFMGYKMHFLWWGLGVACYGLGTALEASVTLFGNTVFLTKAWYIAGALLGGYPLATGTVYLLMRRKTANLLTAISLPVIIGLSICVAISPVNLDQMLPYKPGGAVLGWYWVRLCTPFVNLYAAFFLIGGAIYSASYYAKRKETKHRMIGNILIAVGALLPGIGGSLAKAGIVEGLYIGEFLGIIIIWLGYRSCVYKPAAAEKTDESDGSTTAATP